MLLRAPQAAMIYYVCSDAGTVYQSLFLIHSDLTVLVDYLKRHLTYSDQVRGSRYSWSPQRLLQIPKAPAEPFSGYNDEDT
jgi:hypothetical protein